MKVNLVVAAGVHEGKAIPIPGSSLLVGRDPECNLRPASPAVSKKHCVITVRNGSVFVKDLGSTNGTTVNDKTIAGEREVVDGDRLKIGPLDFFVQILRPSTAPDSTPLPETLKPLSSVGGRLSDGVGVRPTAPAARAATPAPMTPIATPKPATPDAIAETKPASVTKPKTPVQKQADDADDLAAALMAEADESDPMPVPDGSTVVELPAMDLERIRMGGAPAAPAEGKKPIPTAKDSSNAASDALKKYFERKKK